jgi:ubiquinone/menaquinone biosynthesis C-methylase UbiE
MNSEIKMNVQSLREHLDEIAKIPNEQWLSSLDDRKRKELEFHNRDRDRRLMESLDKDTYEKFYANIKYYQTVGRSANYVRQWIERNAPGRVFLDYACGNGFNAIAAAQSGAKLAIGLDISDISVENARKDAKTRNVDNTYFVQADAENTKLPDSSVDLIICSGMLHHLDLSFAFPELRRILAPGGKILALEALDYNPAIKLYRMVTPSMRTEWEKAHILDLKDVRFAERFFDIGEIRYWHILSYAGAYFPRLLPVFNLMDDVLTKVPGLRRMAWIFTFELLSNK